MNWWKMWKCTFWVLRLWLNVCVFLGAEGGRMPQPTRPRRNCVPRVTCIFLSSFFFLLQRVLVPSPAFPFFVSSLKVCLIFFFPIPFFSFNFFHFFLSWIFLRFFHFFHTREIFPRLRHPSAFFPILLGVVWFLCHDRLTWTVMQGQAEEFLAPIH